MQGERRLLRGHYNPVNWSRKYPNLQWARIDGARVKICTGCLRTVNKKAKMKAVIAASKTTAAAESK
jgi:ribosomal protein L28